jgi:hypothetical protein
MTQSSPRKQIGPLIPTSIGSSLVIMMLVKQRTKSILAIGEPKAPKIIVFGEQQIEHEEDQLIGLAFGGAP